ncbi:MAG TPA: VWA domain-containing protein [Spirochaetia bacterium]|nr:VWA domain-containing protein [Spirochaetia bacterium]
MIRNSSKWVVSFCLICIYLSLNAVSSFADTRTENIDMFLVVDKSLSMESKIDSVKQYIDKSIIENMLIPGDYLVVIDFWGGANVLLSTTVGSNKAPIEQEINSIQANGRWTDIGNALDELKRVLDAGKFPDHRKYFMLITDGIQEAPPTSKYYSKNGQFNHAFLDNTKTIQERGWKIEILGIGTETAAADLAKTLSGGFTSVSNNPTPAELQQKTKDFLGLVEASNLSLDPVKGGGKSTIHITLKSTGYTDAQAIDISSIQLEVAGGTALEISTGSKLTLEPNSAKDYSLPVVVSGLGPGDHTAKVSFTFNGNTTFSPAVFDTQVKVNGFVQNNLFAVGGGGLLIVLLALLAVFLITRSAKSRKIGFILTIEGDLKQSNKFVLKAGSLIYVQDAMMGFKAIAKVIDNPVATVEFDGSGLRLVIVNTTRLVGTDIPANVLGERVHLKTNAQKDVFFQFDPA